MNIPSDEQIRPDELARVINNEDAPKGDEKLKDIEPTPANYKRFQGGEKRPLPRGIMLGIVGIVILFVVGFFVSFFIVKQRVKESISNQANTLALGIADLQNLDPQSASKKFGEISGSPAITFSTIFQDFGFLFQGGKNAVGSFGDLTKQLAALSTELSSLKGNILQVIASGHGTGVVASLSAVRGTLQNIDDDANQLSGTMTTLGVASSTFGGSVYLPMKAQIESTGHALGLFIPWFSNPTPHHVLVLFQNPSEMRPGGGFLGSYADVAIAGGNITSMSVHDVADVDTGFTANIVPPKPLQSEIKRFRPADGNWFFNFPTTASETLSFFERSNLYTASGTTFDGVIAISPGVLTDLLSVTGPITVSSTDVTFTSDNVLVQLQKIVQDGQATSATYPKAVLGELSHAILAQLAASSTPTASGGNEDQQLLSMAMNWVSDRDVMAYFKDPAVENYFVSYGAAGSVYQLPQNTDGDYLAIADADINADKSELYMQQQVNWSAQINADGTITDQVVVNRKHDGDQSPYWWYQTTNQDYLQVFVPDGAAFTNETGGVAKKIQSLMSYAHSGYSVDSTIAAIESSTQPVFAYPALFTHEESGKQVFSTWMVTSKGSTSQVEIDYTHRAFIPPAVGVVYQFVFEKQPGTSRTYDFTIDAPLGYVFKENGLARYEYQSDAPPGTLVINLTLENLPQ